MNPDLIQDLEIVRDKLEAMHGSNTPVVDYEIADSIFHVKRAIETVEWERNRPRS